MKVSGCSRTGHEVDFLNKCAKCGACTTVCPVAAITGRESHTARGKLHLFSQAESFASNYYLDLLGKCVQCQACDIFCPRGLTPSRLIRQARGQSSNHREPNYYRKFLVRSLLSHHSLLKLSGQALRQLNDILPPGSGLRHRLEMLLPDLPPTTAPLPTPSADQSPPPTKDLIYFPGCLASHAYKSILQAMSLLAQACGYKLIIPHGLGCCGLASQASGQTHEAQKMLWRNITILGQTTGPIITSCASCWSQLTSAAQLFETAPHRQQQAEDISQRLHEFSTFFQRQSLPFTRARQNIFYHDPCHLRHRPQPILAPPRALLQMANETPILELPTGPTCCGQGGLFHLANPALAQEIQTKLLKKVMNLQPTSVVTSCSGCLLHWQQALAHNNSSIKAQHLAVFLAQQLRC